MTIEQESQISQFKDDQGYKVIKDSYQKAAVARDEGGGSEEMGGKLSKWSLMTRTLTRDRRERSPH